MRRCTLLDNEYINSRTTMKLYVLAVRGSRGIRNFPMLPIAKSGKKEDLNTGKKKKYILDDAHDFKFGWHSKKNRISKNMPRM